MDHQSIRRLRDCWLTEAARAFESSDTLRKAKAERGAAYDHGFGDALEFCAESLDLWIRDQPGASDA